MVPHMNETFKKLKLEKVKLNVNVRSPLTMTYARDSLKSLGPELYERLCKLYEKDFKVFGYEFPSYTQILNDKIEI